MSTTIPDSSVTASNGAVTSSPQIPHPDLLEQMRERLRAEHYSLRTEEVYLGWARRLMQFHGGRHPLEMGATEVEAFLGDVAVRQGASASTQNQALAALLFLYKEVVGLDLPWLGQLARAKRTQPVPTVMTVREVGALLDNMDGPLELVARLLYGTGMRLLEGLNLRVRDVDFATRRITVRNSQGAKNRETILPLALMPPLAVQLEAVRALHEEDLRQGLGSVWLPDALAADSRSLSPYLATGEGRSAEWDWQYVFPSDTLTVDPILGGHRRHHLTEQSMQRAMRKAAAAAGLTKSVSPQTLRHSFAAHLLASGCDTRTVQELMGHKELTTTIAYAQRLNRRGKGVVSPLDQL